MILFMLCAIQEIRSFHRSKSKKSKMGEILSDQDQDQTTLIKQSCLVVMEVSSAALGDGPPPSICK